ncbi:MAG: pyridoxal phosphate-dependent aminotransferase, partial [Sphingopyxis sp.]
MSWNVPAEHPALAPRAAVTALTGYIAGRDAAAVRRDTGFAGTVVKLASNEGADGPFPGAVRAIEAAVTLAQRYPDAGGGPVCAALARFHGVDADEVLLGSGACAVLAHLSSAFLEAGDEVICGHPTFHLYRLEALRMGAIPVPVALRADGSYDLEAMRKAVTARTRIVYVCTPNNPTGGIVARRELAQFLEELPARVLPIIDEAYFEYVEDSQYPTPMRIERPSIRPAVVVRTFSKIYGLAGLRVGYALAPAPIIATCRRIQN